MSVETLKKAMAKDDYHHQPDIPNNFASTINKSDLARKAVMAFKDEYLLNFINVEEIGERDGADIDERVVEQQIVHNIKKFIMTFGHDFTFVGNQYHAERRGVFLLQHRFYHSSQFGGIFQYGYDNWYGCGGGVGNVYFDFSIRQSQLLQAPAPQERIAEQGDEKQHN